MATTTQVVINLCNPLRLPTVTDVGLPTNPRWIKSTQPKTRTPLCGVTKMSSARRCRGFVWGESPSLHQEIIAYIMNKLCEHGPVGHIHRNSSEHADMATLQLQGPLSVCHVRLLIKHIWTSCPCYEGWVFLQLVLSVLTVLMKRFHLCCDEKDSRFWRGTRITEPISREKGKM